MTAGDSRLDGFINISSSAVDVALVISDNMDSMLVGSPGNEVVSVSKAVIGADRGNSGPGGDGNFGTS
jgi:hypothetical protein